MAFIQTSCPNRANTMLSFDRHASTGPHRTPSSYTEKYDGLQGPVTGTTFPSTLSSRFSEMKGRDTPNFKKRKANGELLPMTPYYQVEYEAVQSGSHGNFDYTALNSAGNVINWWSFNYQGVWAPLVIQWGSDYQESLLQDLPYVSHGDLVQKAAAKVASRGFDVLTFAAEANKLRDMFTGLLQRFIRLLRQTKRIPQNLAGAWLEGRYGWRILLFEIESFNEALAISEEKLRGRISERVGFDVDDTFTRSVPFEDTHMLGEWTVTTVRSLGYRGTVFADLKAELPGFRGTVAITALELIPFSFVLEWFLTVGKALEAYEFLSLTTAHTAANGSSVRIEEHWEFRKLRNKAPGDLGWPSNQRSTGGTVHHTCDVKYVMNQRVPVRITTIPQPHLSLNAFKVIDLLALATQIFLGKKR